MKKQIITLCGLMVIGILSGCASGRLYESPVGSPAETSQIRIAEHVAVLSIDNEQVVSRMKFLYGPLPRTIVIKPGKHRYEITVQYYWNFRKWLWLNAESGKVYVLKYEIDKDSPRFWFEDGATGNVVGGLVGSDDEPIE